MQWGSGSPTDDEIQEQQMKDSYAVLRTQWEHWQKLAISQRATVHALDNELREARIKLAGTETHIRATEMRMTERFIEETSDATV